MEGLSIDDIKLGRSASRNPELVNIFHRLHLVEAYGTGIPRIFELYNLAKNQPEIKIATNTFYLKIPKYQIDEKYQKVMEYLSKNEKATREDLERVLQLKKTGTTEIINKLLAKNIITKEGTNKNTIYKLK